MREVRLLALDPTTKWQGWGLTHRSDSKPFATLYLTTIFRDFVLLKDGR